MRKKYGAYLRVLDAIPADCYNKQPVLGMKAPTQLAVHLSDSIVSQIAEEFLHRRGQLYVFARACGVEPPFMWGFGENAPEFRPEQ